MSGRRPSIWPRDGITPLNTVSLAEIKFDGDPWSEGQELDYRKIAGEGKLAELTPSDCSCDDPDRKKRTEDLKNQELKDEVMGMLDIAAGGGRRARRPRLPKKVPNLKFPHLKD